MTMFNFDPKVALQHYMQKRFDKVSQMFIDVFLHFDKVWYGGFSRSDLLKLEEFVATFLYIWTRPDFKLPSQYNTVFSNIGHLIANVVAMSSYGSTDGALGHILAQDHNYYRMLPLLTVYNTIQISAEQIVNVDPIHGTLWWLAYQTASPGSLTQEVHDRMVRQYFDIPKDLKLRDCRVAPLYFQVSYFAPERARAVKTVLNDQIASQIKVSVCNKPNVKSIAIVSGRWQPTTAVYKSMAPQVHALASKYDLTLVQFGENESLVDRSHFKSVVQVKMFKDFTGCDISAIKNNDFQLAFFPDVGMNFESTWLSNLRIAPIMVTGYGHPVSTFSRQMDYFIGGQEVERADLASENYDERLVLIPGLGCYPIDPKYTRKGRVDSKEIWVNCCWTTHKINYPMLCVLRTIQQLAPRPVKFHFYPSWTLGKYNNLIYFVKTLNQFFGYGNWRYDTNLKYHDYLASMEQAAFTIDSYPFGGYNTIIDSLFVGCPVVAIEGTQFANRASSALLRRVGLDDLIVSNLEECAAKALELASNPDYLESARSKLADVDNLQQLLLHAEEPGYFVKAIDYLIANHEQLQASPKTCLTIG